MNTGDSWRSATFAGLIEAGLLQIGDGYRAKNEELGGNGPIFLRAGHVSDETIDFAGVERFHAHLTDRVRPKMAHPGDAVITTKGNSTGRVTYVHDRLPPFVYSPHLSYWRSCRPDRLVPRFLYYWSRSSEFNAQLRGMSASTDMAPYLSLQDQRRLKITIPPTKHQKLIAEVLGSLDDKIELNRRMNETLEAMARTLFESWFVSFAPVHAKAAVRREHPNWSNAQVSKAALPKLASDMADRFPDHFEGSDPALIPAGWTLSKLFEHVEASKGLSYKGNGLAETGLPMHNLNSVYEGGGYKYEGIKFYAGEHRERHLVNAGDVIVANTEQGHDCLLLGYAAIVPGTFGPTGLYSHHIYRLQIRETSGITPDFLCRLLNSRRMHRLVSGFGNGTTVNMLPLDGMQQPEFILPPSSLIEAFSTLAAGVRRRQEAFVAQNRDLTRIRDSLLPRLLSGELCATETECKHNFRGITA